MGAWLSHAWSNLVRFITGLRSVPTGYRAGSSGGDSEVYYDWTDENMDVEDERSQDVEEPSDGTELRRRMTSTTPDPKVERSSSKSESTSPLKSDWNESAEHPKPKLDVAPPNKKSKTENEEKATKVEFKTVPNLHFGDQDEMPKSLSPDSVISEKVLDSLGPENADTSTTQNFESSSESSVSSETSEDEKKDYEITQSFEGRSEGQKAIVLSENETKTKSEDELHAINVEMESNLGNKGLSPESGTRPPNPGFDEDSSKKVKKMSTELEESSSKSPISDSHSRKPPRTKPSSPLKSHLVEDLDERDPKLNVAPPTKKTKTDVDRKVPTSLEVTEKMHFESVPDLHFGNADGNFCPETLSPDSVMPRGIPESREMDANSGYKASLEVVENADSTEMTNITDDSKIDDQVKQKSYESDMTDSVPPDLVKTIQKDGNGTSEEAGSDSLNHEVPTANNVIEMMQDTHGANNDDRNAQESFEDNADATTFTEADGSEKALLDNELESQVAMLVDPDQSKGSNWKENPRIQGQADQINLTSNAGAPDCVVKVPIEEKNSTESTQFPQTGDKIAGGIVHDLSNTVLSQNTKIEMVSGVEICDAKSATKIGVSVPLGVKEYLIEASDADTDKTNESDEQKPAEDMENKVVAYEISNEETNEGNQGLENIIGESEMLKEMQKSEIETSEIYAAEALIEIGKKVDGAIFEHSAGNVSINDEIVAVDDEIKNKQGSDLVGESPTGHDEMDLNINKEEPVSVEYFGPKGVSKLVDYSDEEMVSSEKGDILEIKNHDNMTNVGCEISPGVDDEHNKLDNHEQAEQIITTNGSGEQLASNNFEYVDHKGSPLEVSKEQIEQNLALGDSNQQQIESNNFDNVDPEQPQLDGSQEQDKFISENGENIDPNIQPKINTKTKQVCVQWTGKANEVLITGSWLDWKDKVALRKTDEYLWSVNLDLDKNLKDIEMKFVVDGEWLVSPDIPTVKDMSGNRNNYIKLMHY
uniref:uncharacterized protein LOC120329897 n=1 Tax=Styela clava TaxID=7725 RepID=UPI00193A8A44|nr:uncharacterized protein LOC120329897 [Styela clava]